MASSLCEHTMAFDSLLVDVRPKSAHLWMGILECNLLWFWIDDRMQHSQLPSCLRRPKKTYWSPLGRGLSSTCPSTRKMPLSLLLFHGLLPQSKCSCIEASNLHNFSTPSLIGCLIRLKMLKSRIMFLKVNCIKSLLQSIKALHVANNGLLRMLGIWCV